MLLRRNLPLALLINRSRWFIIADSLCSTLAVLMGITSLSLCIVWSPVNSPKGRYRDCVVFEVDFRFRPYKAAIRFDPCSQNWLWPLLPSSVSVTPQNSWIRLPVKSSTLHYLGPTFPSRMAGWHYVPLANVSSMKCSPPCSTARPTFQGYTFRPSSGLPFL